jgi:DNA-directed RNA polymerase specialized sigma54-like protein
MKALPQCQNTLNKIVQHILKLPNDFPENGRNLIRPENQKQVAEPLEMHPSTFSQAIQNKDAQILQKNRLAKVFFSHGNHGSRKTSDALRQGSKILSKIKTKMHHSEMKKLPQHSKIKASGLCGEQQPSNAHFSSFLEHMSGHTGN